MCLQFSVDNYLLQTLGWALTENGDSLQSLVDAKFGKQIHSMNILPYRHCLITLLPLHYITLHVMSMSRNPRLGCRRSSLISIDHAELLRSTPSLVLCCAWLVTMALHVHCGLGQLSPLLTSGDDKWVAAKHCGRAKQSRIIHPPIAVKLTVPQYE